MVKLCILLLFFLDLVKGQGKDPCLTATLIHDDKRNVNYNQTSGLCDRLLQPGFYRFDNAEIPFTDTCIENYHCGTHLPLWIQGNSYPSVSDGIQLRNICANVVANDNNCCDYKRDVAVKNCGTYFVYYLQPTSGCSMAYCTENSPRCSGPKFSKTGFPPCTDAYPILTKTPSLSNPILSTNDFEFHCHIPYPPNKKDATFEVTWLINGRPTQSIPRQTISGGQRDVTLQGGSLYGHINNALSCSVVSTFTDKHTGGLKSPPKTSNEYFVGIQISRQKITVGGKNPDQKIFVTSTIPIVCRHQTQQTCSLIFTVTTDNENLSPSTCHVTLTPTDWNPVTSTAMTSFLINTSPSYTATPAFTSIVHFGVNTVPGWEWSGLKLQNITVVANSTRQGAQCKSIGDPHYFTFDYHLQNNHKRFSNFQVGQFTLVKQKRGSFKVETRTWRRPGTKPSFNCAVAAREGNDVIVLDMCDGPFGKTYPKLKIQNPAMFENKTEIVKEKSGNVFAMKFKSGAVVKVHQRKSMCLDVYVNLPGTFAEDTVGLCGTFDGNPNNDLQHPNGHIDAFSQLPNSFINSWKIPIGSSLFEKAEPLPTAKSRQNFCTCNKQTNKQDCNATPFAMPPISAFCMGCTIVDPVPHLPQPMATASVWITTQQPPVIQTSYIFPPPTQPPQQTAPISKPTATMYCFDLLYKYPSAKKCINDFYQMGFTEIVDMCVEDIELTGDKDMGLSALAAMMEGCGFSSLINFTNIVNGTFITPPEAKVCPGACSGNGDCQNGICTCAPGFESSDCSVNKTKLPSITDISGGSACDSKTDACNKPVVLGENMNYNTTACSIREIHFSQFGSSTLDMTANRVTADFMSTNHVACPLPKHPYDGDRIAIKGYLLSLTNNVGLTEGNSFEYYIYNSKCMECDRQGSCSIKPDTCMIENKCYLYGDQDSADFQGWCVPTVSNTQWTNQSPGTTDAPITTTEYLPPPTKISHGSGTLNNYTAVGTGCGCYFDVTSTDCACCKNYGCPCDSTSRHVCFDCVTPEMCHN